MTTDELMALADDYASNHNAHTINQLKEARAALLAAVESMAQELEAAKAETKRYADSVAELELAAHQDGLLRVRYGRERDALQAKLTELEKQEPVAYRAWFDADNGARWLFSLWPEEERLEVDWQPLYIAAGAAPKQPSVADFVNAAITKGSFDLTKQDARKRAAHQASKKGKP